MMRFIDPRLRKPAVAALAGTVFAAAWLVRGGPGWFLSIVIEVGVLVPAIVWYVRSGREGEAGALVGSRPDERQKLISLRSRALAGNFAIVAAFVGLTAGVAAKATWWWPFAVVLAVSGFAYYLGLSNYGVGEEGPAEDGSPDPEARSPISW